MPREVYIAGSLFLSTPEAEALFDQLSDSGIVLEFLSGLLSERASGVRIEDVRNLQVLLNEVSTRLSSMQMDMSLVKYEVTSTKKTVETMAYTGVGVGKPASAPVAATGEPAVQKQEPVVKSAGIDLTKAKGKTGGMMSKFAKMTGKVD